MDVGDAISFVQGHADVYRLFDDPMRLREIAAALVEPFRGDVTKVAGLEARGFVFATAAALDLNLGLVPKGGVRDRTGLARQPERPAGSARRARQR